MQRQTQQIQQPLQLPVEERKCQTCLLAMAVEYRGEPGGVLEEVIYFCIEKPCPMYHKAQ